jgi:Amiloride-sensitive sodium channel
MFSYLIFETTTKFLEGKIILELSREELHISGVPFPAVTVCPQVFFEKNLPQTVDWKTFNLSSDKYNKLT